MAVDEKSQSVSAVSARGNALDHSPIREVPGLMRHSHGSR